MEKKKKTGPGKRGSAHYIKSEKNTDQITDQIKKEEIKNIEEKNENKEKKIPLKSDNKKNKPYKKKSNVKYQFDNKKKRYNDNYINYKKEIGILKKNQQDIKLKLTGSSNHDVKPLLFSLTAIIFSLIAILLSIFSLTSKG